MDKRSHYLALRRVIDGPRQVFIECRFGCGLLGELADDPLAGGGLVHLGPDLLPVIWAKVAASDSAASCVLDGAASAHGDLLPVPPVADHLDGHAQQRGELC